MHQICFFNVFCVLKSWKSKRKVRYLLQNLAKKKIWACTRMLVKCFIRRKYVFIVFHTFMYLRTCFHHWRQVFFLGIKPSISVPVQIQKHLLKFATNFLLFLSFFSFFAQKMLKKHILTSVWSGQHQNAGWNIQQRFHDTKWLLHYKLLHNKRVNNFLGRFLIGRSPVFCVPWFYVWSCSSDDIPLHFPSCPFHLFLVSDLKKI